MALQARDWTATWWVCACIVLSLLSLPDRAAAGKRKGINIGEARLWDVESGKQRTALPGFKQYAEHTAFSPDGGAVAISGSRTVRLFDPSRGTESKSWDEDELISSLAFCPNGKLLGVLGSFGAIKLREINGAKTTTARSQWNLRSLAFGRDGKIAVTGGGDKRADPGKVEFWDAQTGRRLGELDFPEMVFQVAVSPDGKFLVVAGGNGALKLYDWETKKESFPIEGQAPVAFSWDSKFLVTNSSVRDPEIRIWDLATGKKKFAFRLGYIHYPAALAISPNGKIIATGGTDDEKMLSLWDAETGKEIRRITDTNVPIESLAFSPDGKLLASAGWTRKFIREGEEEEGEQSREDSDGWQGVLLFGGSIAIIAALLGVIALVRPWTQTLTRSK